MHGGTYVFVVEEAMQSFSQSVRIWQQSYDE